MSEALEALTPSVGGDEGELGEGESDAGLCECSEGGQGAQEPVDAFALRVCWRCCRSAAMGYSSAGLRCLGVLFLGEVYPKRHFFVPDRGTLIKRVGVGMQRLNLYAQALIIPGRILRAPCESPSVLEDAQR